MMFNTKNDLLNTGSQYLPSRLIKSYPEQSHKLVRPKDGKYRKIFNQFHFYDVSPAYETQVIETPDLRKEPEIGFIDLTNLETHKEELTLWLFWLICLPRKQKEKLAEKAKHIAQLYLRITTRPETIDDTYKADQLPTLSRSETHNPNDDATLHYCYQIALISAENYWWHPRAFRCIGWAEYELIRRNHLTPDITLQRHPFLATVVENDKDKTIFNTTVEKELAPFFPKFWPLGANPKAYPSKAPTDIPRYAITKDEYLLHNCE